jgi:hypothetical protein
MSLLERMHPRSCISYGCGGMLPKMGRDYGDDSPSKKRRALHERVARLLLDMDDTSCSSSPPPSSSGGGGDGGTDEKKKRGAAAAVRKRRLGAIQSLYKLSNDRDNRMPLLCTSSIDVLPALISCLQLPTDKQISKRHMHSDDVEIRRLSCLVLNNLSTPLENKAIMVLGQHSHPLLETLVRVIETASPESHLCMICLYNLSFLDDIGVDVLMKFVPGEKELDAHHASSSVEGSPHGHIITRNEDCSASFGSPSSTSSKKSTRRQRHRHHRIGATTMPSSPLPLDENGALLDLSCPALRCDHSLLRVLESMVRTYSPFLQSAVTSVEGEAIRWAMGLLCNFCKDPDEVHRINLILQTELIPCAVKNLMTTVRPMNKWTENSLEEFTLILLCHVVKVEAGRIALGRMGALDAIEPIIGKGGIHDHRAGVIQCALVDGVNGWDATCSMAESPDIGKGTMAEF